MPHRTVPPSCAHSQCCPPLSDLGQVGMLVEKSPQTRAFVYRNSIMVRV